MDTISIKINFAKFGVSYFNIKELEGVVNSIESPYGFTYCDTLNITDDYLTIKVSYPRFFRGINAYLVKSSFECLEVNRNLVYNLENVLAKLYLKIISIELIRVDIPFTYLIPKEYIGNGKGFASYEKVFRILSYVYHYSRRGKSIATDTKGIIDMISASIETVNFNLTKTSGGNAEITIYNQYLNIQRKTSDISMFDNYNTIYPDLRQRIRIESKKRIRRKSLTSMEFANFNILKTYGDERKKFLLEHLFNKKTIEFIYNDFFIELDRSYKQFLYTHNGRINYTAWIHSNENLILDYQIVRRVLVNNIYNRSTLESAITAVRKELKFIEDRGTLILNVSKIIDDMRSCIKNYNFDYSAQEEIVLGKQDISMDIAQDIPNEPLDEYIVEE